MKGNTIVSAGQAWGPSPSLVSRKPAGDGQPFLTLESYRGNGVEVGQVG